MTPETRPLSLLGPQVLDELARQGVTVPDPGALTDLVRGALADYVAGAQHAGALGVISFLRKSLPRIRMIDCLTAPGKADRLRCARDYMTRVASEAEREYLPVAEEVPAS